MPKAAQPEDSSPDLSSILDRFERAGRETRPPRDEIIASWQRSSLDGLRADRLDVPYRADVDDEGRLAWAAKPVIDGIAEDLRDTGIGLLLADERSHIVSRRTGDRAIETRLDNIQLGPGFVYSEDSVGTNAIGTAIERRGPFVVEGSEHFADALTVMACTAIPLTDPGTGQVIGAIDLTCSAEDFSPLMLPLAKRAALEIEQRLRDDASADERLLREHFLKARRGVRAPLAMVNERTFLINSAAGEILQPSDHARLWDWSKRWNSDRDGGSEISLASGTSAIVRCEPVLDGLRLVGALIRLDKTPEDTVDAPAPAAVSTPRYGLPSLTATERAVAEHVAEGLTNAETAERMFLSPHTIDFHLRQVFRKLGVRSRVELTRVLLGARADSTN